MYKAKRLDYNYDSLEPYIDTHTLALHYQKHYLTYLKNLNMLLQKNNFDFSISKEEIFISLDLIAKEDRDNVLFNLGGVLNHELYFDTISDRKRNRPEGEILKLIVKTYGNYEKFVEIFQKTALSLKGSGYTFLVMDTFGRLDIINLKNQESPYSYHLFPLFAIELWEQA